MKKFLLALCFTVLGLQFMYAPPPPPGCECCAGIPEPELAQCIDDCDNDPEGDWCSDTLPLDSNMVFLLAVALAFGTYSVYQNKKRLQKN